MPISYKVSRKFLLVDDCQTNHQAICLMLNFNIYHKLEYNIIIDQAYDGERAIEICQSMIEKITDNRSSINSFYDLIIMDYEMPKMDGVTATRVIRQICNKNQINTKILLLTAHNYIQNLENDEEIFDAQCSKPIKSEQLKYILQQFNLID